MQKKIWVILFLIFLIFTSSFFSCTDQKIKVALITNLTKASEIGESEVLMSKLYLKLNPDSKIKIEYFNDGWDKDLVKKAIKEVLNKKIKFLITTHTSTVANEILDIINSNDILDIVCGATTINLSHKDDNHVRIVADVEEEQRQIANHINELKGKTVVLLIDSVNRGYTFLAKDYFKKYCNKNIFQEIYFDAENFNIDDLSSSFQNINNIDFAYFVVGSGFKRIGAIARFLLLKNKNIKIVFTPWVINQKLINIIGLKSDNIIFSSFLPDFSNNMEINDIKNKFFKEYNIFPTIISYKVYEALEILDFAFKNKFIKPVEVKKFLLEKKQIPTFFEDIIFDQYLDSHTKLYFLSNLYSFY